MAHITPPGSSSSKAKTSEDGSSPSADSPSSSSQLRFGDPWRDPPEAQDTLRRLRGRLVLPVTVWLAWAGKGGAEEEPVGLTVSSALMSQGEPAMLAGLVSPASDLGERLQGGNEVGGPARFAVHVLSAPHKRIAQHFAGQLPAPPELLAHRPSPYGPLLDAVPDRVLCRRVASKPFGWSLLVEAEVEDVRVGGEGKGLAWWRGQFHNLT